MNYTVYKTTNLLNSMIYIGVHSTENPNDNYLGSGLYLQNAIKKYGAKNFKKEILFIFDNEKEMYDKEVMLVDEEFIKRKDTYNLSYGGYGNWKHSIGKVVVKDQDGKTFQVSKNNPRYLSGELVHIHKGKIFVKDTNGKTFQVSKNDPRYLSGELVGGTKGQVVVKDHNGKVFQVPVNDLRFLKGDFVGIAKGINLGKVSVKDKNGNTFRVSKNDPRYLNGELISITFGLVPVKDKDGNTFRVSKNDPRYLNGELVYIHKGKVPVKDKDGNTFQVSKDDPRYLSGELICNLQCLDKQAGAKNWSVFYLGDLIGTINNLREWVRKTFCLENTRVERIVWALTRGGYKNYFIASSKTVMDKREGLNAYL